MEQINSKQQSPARRRKTSPNSSGSKRKSSIFPTSFRKLKSQSSSSASKFGRKLYFDKTFSAPSTNINSVIDQSDTEEMDEDNKDFFEMIGRLQSNRLDDQRTSLRIKAPPAKLPKPLPPLPNGGINQNGNAKPAEKKKADLIHEVIAAGGPYPLVVLPVEGEYWMEGSNHALSLDYHRRPLVPKLDMESCCIEEDHSVFIYRRHFFDKEHLNFCGLDSKYGPLLLSMRYETHSDIDLETEEFYSALLRLKDQTMHTLIPLHHLSDVPGPREIVSYILEEESDTERFHPIAIPRISEQILRYDEHVITNQYKIGVIYQCKHQTTEEEYFGNKTYSPALKEFLDFLADEVQLKSFTKYRGGLDVKCGQTGESSYYTCFENREIMFHVSTLLPFTPGDIQQVQRKRHIGNDIVAIVFQDENTPFSPVSIRSHFLHVFIVVQVIDPNTPDTKYKICVTSRDGVPPFGPSLPNPAVFRKNNELREFLLTKILNAELAACKSDRFSQLADRTRSMFLSSLVSDICAKNEQILEEDGTRMVCDPTSKGSLLSSFRMAFKHKNGTLQSTSSNEFEESKLKSQSHSLSLNDLTAIGDEPKKENLIKPEKKASVSNSKDQRRNKKDKKQKEPRKAHTLSSSSISALSPVSPQSWFNASPPGVQGETLNFYSKRPTSAIVKSPDSATSTGQQFHNLVFDLGDSNSGSSSPSGSRSVSVTSQEPPLFAIPATPLRPSPTDNRVPAEGVSWTTFEESRSKQGSMSGSPRSRFLSISSCSSLDDVSNASTGSATESLQEADVLKAEIARLKADKMELVRQNVILQRLHEAKTQQSNSMDNGLLQPRQHIKIITSKENKRKLKSKR